VGGDVEYRGPRITISPSHSYSYSVVEEEGRIVVGGVVIGAGGEYRSRGGSNTKKGDSSKKGEANMMPSITVEFAD